MKVLDKSVAAATTPVMSQNHVPPDANLVAKSLAGDGEAFGCLYDRYARLVRAVVSGAGRDAAIVHDLTQECFLRAFRNLARLRRPDRFGPWIFGIARQVSREHRRFLRRNRLRFGAAEATGAWSHPDVSAAVQTTEEIELVLRRVSELPERERQAIHAFFLEERNAEEAARILRLSRSGIYALLERALARLARSMSPGRGRDIEK